MSATDHAHETHGHKAHTHNPPAAPSPDVSDDPEMAGGLGVTETAAAKIRAHRSQSEATPSDRAQGSGARGERGRRRVVHETVLHLPVREEGSASLSPMKHPPWVEYT